MGHPDYHRRSIRLPDHDYRQAGAYFVTIVAYQREDLFGKRVGRQIVLSALGETVQYYWNRLPGHFPVELDEWVVMPNHLHAILFLLTNDTKDINLPAVIAKGTQPGSVGAIIQNFKSNTTRAINKIRSTPDLPVWQRNYFEHILRDNDDLDATRFYIRENPVRDEDH